MILELDKILDSSSNNLEMSDGIHKKTKFTKLEPSELEAMANLAVDVRQHHIIKLLNDLGAVSREFWLKQFRKLCGYNNKFVDTLRLLGTIINFTREEFEALVKHDQTFQHQSIIAASFKNLAQLKYLFELIEELGLNSKEIVNSDYNRIFSLNTLLNEAIAPSIYAQDCVPNIDLIKFLVSKGADPQIRYFNYVYGNWNALDIALFLYNQLQQGNPAIATIYYDIINLLIEALFPNALEQGS